LILTHLLRFLVPQYLFVWRSDDPEDDLGEYFVEILESLKTPLLHSMEAFLLPDTHDRIRCFREALRSGPGLMVKRDRAKELDFWDWPLSKVKDMTLHKAFRANNGIPDRMRWLTGWDVRGKKELAPGLWPELFDCWNMRRLDMVDCFACAASKCDDCPGTSFLFDFNQFSLTICLLSLVRDSISRDPLHHSFMWDVSQNVTRAPFRSATVGVSGYVKMPYLLFLLNNAKSALTFFRSGFFQLCHPRRRITGTPPWKERDGS
jgi:hypothetical protein